VEIIEIKNHPNFLGCQFHSEFKSRPFAPHPLFRRFIRAALEARASGRRGKPASNAGQGVGALSAQV